MTPKTLFCLTLVAILGLFLIDGELVTGRDPESDPESTYSEIKIFAEVLNEIEKKYVEKEVPKTLIYGAIKGMVATLDPHSSFLSPEEYKELTIETKGSFSGIGIEITLKDGVLTVVSPIEDTPAFQAGLKAGDRIIKINGKLTKNMSLMDAVRGIRGVKGSTVTLSILREGANKLKDYVIAREVIPIKSVKFETLEPGYVYVRVSTFQDTTHQDLVRALKTLQESNKPIKGLVLDMRNNPGGLLDQAVKVTNEFLESGLIVYTMGRNKTQDLKFFAHPNDHYQDYPIIALVNEGSASASEIVAGALQDHKRAVILGSQTFGKGSVQTIIPLEDGSALRLTTAKYYTPNGRDIQAKGITPDIVVETAAPKENNNIRYLREKDLEGHIKGKEEADDATPDKTQDKTPDKAKPQDKSLDKGRDKDHDKDRSLDKTKETTHDDASGDQSKVGPEDRKVLSEKERLAKDAHVQRALQLLKSWGIFTQTLNKQPAVSK
ncbi:MAG: S41 family peptidase [Deltaproteobacteria bacterium]|nr:S41 family peptidase [Deltaproteobacteria bacterium]MBF0526285.1 S41 family peptidase [Deltaproteobacteria bacterium]